MNKFLACTLFVLSMATSDLCASVDIETFEKDIEAMKSIIEDFCQRKKLCNETAHGNFTVYRLHDETRDLLTEVEKKILESCRQTFEIRMNRNSVGSLHIYCYDNAQPKLLIDKELKPAR